MKKMIMAQLMISAMENEFRCKFIYLILFLSLMILNGSIIFPLDSANAQTDSGTGVDVLDRDTRQLPPEPLSRPRLAVGQPEGDGAASDAGAKFLLSSVEVEGSMVFSSQELTARYADQIGRQISVGDLMRIADEMSARYRDAGYILSRVAIPAQELDPEGADVRLVAIEGFLGAIIWQGDQKLVEKVSAYFSASQTKLLSLRPLRYAELERAVNLLSDVAGLTVSTTFAKSEVPGASDLVISVERRIAEGFLSFGNTGTESAGPWLMSANISFSTIPFVGGRTSISYSRAVDWREYYSLSLSHRHQWENGFSLFATYAFSESRRPGTEFAKLFDHATRSDTFSLGVGYALIRGRDLNLSLGAVYTHRDSSADLLGAPFTRDKIRSLAFDINFDFSDELGGVTQIIPSVTFGLNSFGATDHDPLSSSPLAPANFSRVNLHVSRQQNLPLDFSLVATGEIQLAGTVLPSYEQFSLGGQIFGRGYDSGTLEGDNGAAGSLEMRRIWRFGDQMLMPYAFIDGGTVWTKGRIDGVDPHAELSSAGLGLRFSSKSKVLAISGFSFNVFVAKPLKTINYNSSARWVGLLSFNF
jgi:hemolysin activation/secretion protein